MSLVESEQPPENCPVCQLTEQRDREEDARELSSGVAWHGMNYHIHDFVMIKAEQGRVILAILSASDFERSPDLLLQSI